MRRPSNYPGQKSRGASVGNPTAVRLLGGTKQRAVIEMEDIHWWHTVYRRPVPIRGGGRPTDNCASGEGILRYPSAP